MNFLHRTDLKYELPPVPQQRYQNAIKSGYQISHDPTKGSLVFAVKERATKITSESDMANALEKAKLIAERKYYSPPDLAHQTMGNYYYGVYAHDQVRDMHARTGKGKKLTTMRSNKYDGPGKKRINNIKMVHRNIHVIPPNSHLCQLAEAMSYYEQCGSKPFYLISEDINEYLESYTLYFESEK